jgi:hypothetical protein
MRNRDAMKFKPEHPRAFAAVATGAQALGTLALGAFALGAMAIGAVAIGRLAVGRARIRRLEIDELVVRRLRVLDELATPATSAADRGEQTSARHEA